MNIDLQAREIQPLRQTLTRVAEHLGGDKAASRYLEATIGAQPAANFHYRPTWQPEFELFDTARTASVMAATMPFDSTNWKFDSIDSCCRARVIVQLA